MVHLHYLAKTYGRRPSDYLGAVNNWTAYQFDSAVLTAGLAHEVEAGGADGQPARRPGKWAKPTGAGRQLTTRSLPKQASGYQSIKTAVGPNIRKMAIPENGVW